MRSDNSKMRKWFRHTLQLLAAALLLLHMRDIDGQLKQLQIVLKRMEIPQQTTGRDAGVPEEIPLEADYVSSIGIVNVERPVLRTWTQTLERLDSLGQSDPVIERIRAESFRYPERMLTALANNPEMADYVAGYLSGGERGAAGLTDLEKNQEFPLFLQWDPRWGYEAYGRDSFIGVSGCGPACLAMALYYLTGDESFMPDRIADYAMENGYYVEGTGTAWALVKDFPRFYGVRVTELEREEEIFRTELDQDGILICAMGKGEFTTAGHFIVIYGYDDRGLLVNDPNCVARSRKRWQFDEIGGQIKGAWALHGGEARDSQG